MSYAIAIGAVGLALLLRIPFWTLLDTHVPFLTFFPAVMLSAWIGGLGPGMTTTVLSAFIAQYFFVEPIGSTRMLNPADPVSLALFLCIGTFISWVTGQLQTSRRQEQHLRLVAEQTLVSIGDAVIATAADGTVTFLNRAAEELTDWTSGEAIGRPVEDVFRIVNDKTGETVESPVTRVLREGTVQGLANHTQLISRHGTHTPIEDTGSPIRGRDGEILGAVLVFRDITEKRHQDRALSDSREQLQTMLESITDAFIAMDATWHLTYVNRAAERLLGKPAEYLVGRDHWEEYPDARDSIVGLSYRAAVEEQKPVHFENYYRPLGRWFEVNAYPAKNGGLSVYFRDVTDRKLLEHHLLESEARLRRANDELQQFSYAASHDLKEPLRTVSSYVQLLERRYRDQLDESGAELIRFAVDGTMRMQQLVDALLDYARAGEVTIANTSTVRLEDAVQASLSALKAAIEEAAAVITYDALPEITADPILVNQVVQNLISNALKYRKPDEPPRVHVSAHLEGDVWIVSVRDNGEGIALEYHESIFGAFNRLHGSDVSGAGIGLTTCKKIVERWGGRIWVDSQSGEGATFLFTLPAAAEHTSRASTGN